ncbi:hypothetical protein Pmar_PMAR000682 [Perkinsus marinus ATCC 50983]|uniref:Uncharacterized protein n=1 Tax=Perkinsus marinus (strain ATCC 50983 / TXsc) TaxID=423536 RepID=C5KRH4_PERM5|nr:hypothetical protein Pmar_PMAR000682 [Perkinsus marinus ATCC 50983]EER12947.1 hypothetical protein Pmar_PMAR000682 [Perkinsus marinus ATCC 50983]|eukprot:XP_002781152.1 hypothetical protein Pmar_PMAR000682 [Perkinsus marinus ATCC 50983]
MFSTNDHHQQQQQQQHEEGQQHFQLQQGFGILPASSSTTSAPQNYQQSSATTTTTATATTSLTATAQPSLTLNFDDDNDLLRSACDSPKFTPPSPATIASTTSTGLECSSLSDDSGYSTSASSNVSNSLSPLPAAPLPASPLSTSTTTPKAAAAAGGAMLPPVGGPTRTKSEKLEAENAVLTNACLGLLELLNSQRGGNPGAASAAYNALLSRVSAASSATTTTAATSTSNNNVSTPSLSPCDNISASTFATGATSPSTTTNAVASSTSTLSSNVYPTMATTSISNPQAPQYGSMPISRQQGHDQMQQQQPTLASPMPTFTFPGATGIPRSQVGGRLNDLSSSNANTNMSCYGRRKSYGAPPGVWRNPYGYVSTVYVNKKRVYGPLRKTIEDASRDREAMVQAKEYVTSVEEMRAFVREFLKPNPHGGVAESAVLPNLPALEEEMLVTL